MSDAPETPAERAEAAATRRRWITLAEVVGVAGVLIAAASLWLGWSDRRQDRADQDAAKASVAKAQTVVRLRGVVGSHGAAISLSDASQQVDTVDVTFPSALGVPARTGVVPPRVEAEWFEAALLKATDGGADEQEGHLPALITSHWVDGETPHTDTAIYDLVWKTKGRLLQGRALTLEGIVLRERSSRATRLDALWKKP